MDYEFESITPWNGEHDTGRDVRLKLDRNFAKIKSNFEELASSRYVTTDFFARLFAPEGEDGAEVDVNDMEAVINAVRVKFGLHTDSYISAKGNNPESGSTVAGASALVDLSDVDISNPTDGQIFAWDAARQKWVNADAPSAGLDEAALAEYLTANHYAKTTDIPSLEGYATQTWASGQFALKTVAINAGTGLTGGGNLSANRTLSLATVGTAGTYTKVTVDAYGRVTGHASLAAGDIPALAISKITGLQAALDAKMDAADFEELFEKVYVSGYGYAIRAKLALYTDSWMSAKGSNPDAGSVVTGGIDEEELAEYLTTHGYATQSWVNQQGFLKSVAWGDVTGKPSPLANDQYYYGHGQLTTDFNDAVKGGAYYTANEAWPSNGPGTSYRYGALAVFHTGTDNMRVAQLWISHHSASDGGVYVRMKYEQADGNWQPWARLLDNNCIGSYALTPSNYTDYTVTKTGGGASGTWGIAVTGNAGSATRLQTARTLWGQSFNGTDNVSGELSGVGGIRFSTEGSVTYDKYGNPCHTTTLSTSYWSVKSASGGIQFSVLASNGNVGIGTNSPSHKLHVAGGIYSSNYLQVGSARLRWDSATGALYVQKSDGTACGFYATGFISTKGANNDAGSAVAGASALSELDDVSISSPVNGQALIYRDGVWKNETVNYGITMDVDWDDVKNKPAWIGSTKPSYSYSEITGTPSVTVSSSNSTNLTVNVEGASKSVTSLYATYLGGTTKQGLFTGLTYSSNKLSVTVGGTTKSVTINAGGGSSLANVSDDSSGIVVKATSGTVVSIVGQSKPFYIDSQSGQTVGLRFEGNAETGVGVNMEAFKPLSAAAGKLYLGTSAARWLTVYSVNSLNTSSDLRLKDVRAAIPLTVAQVAAAPSFLYRWKKGADTALHAGSSAQYWQQALPQAVAEGADGYLAMEYDRIALAAAIAVAKSVIDHETRIRRLEQQLDKTPAPTP